MIQKPLSAGGSGTTYNLPAPTILQRLHPCSNSPTSTTPIATRRCSAATHSKHTSTRAYKQGRQILQQKLLEPLPLHPQDPRGPTAPYCMPPGCTCIWAADWGCGCSRPQLSASIHDHMLLSTAKPCHSLSTAWDH
jgi:hypothetical protein